MKIATPSSSYAWRRSMPVSAEVIGAELEKLQEENGGLTPSILVEAARPESNPLHRLFVWDNDTAGEKYRQIQAGYILRNLKIEYTRTEQQTNEQPRVLLVQAFVNVEKAAETESGKDGDEPEAPQRVYLHNSVAFQDPQHRRYLLDRAKSDLAAWRNRYAVLKEFDEVVKEIDRTLKTLTTEIKAAA